MAMAPIGPRRHETRALLRAHLAAASRYRHTTRHCPICHRLLRLALEGGAEPEANPVTTEGTAGTARAADTAGPEESRARTASPAARAEGPGPAPR